MTKPVQITVKLVPSVVSALADRAEQMGLTRHAFLVAVLTNAAFPSGRTVVELRPAGQHSDGPQDEPAAEEQAADVGEQVPERPGDDDEHASTVTDDVWAETEPRPHRHRFVEVVPGSDNYRMGIHYATLRCACGEVQVGRV